MDIQKVQNYNTNFGAKLHLQGDVKAMKRDCLKCWEDLVRQIGTKKDKIIINIGNEHSSKYTERILDGTKMEEGYKFPIYHHECVYEFSRNVSVASLINGELESAMLTPYSNFKITDRISHRKDKHTRIADAVSEYLKSLISE